MGNLFSRNRRDGPAPATVSSDVYYSRHAGLRNPRRVEVSLITTRVRSPNPSDTQTLKVLRVDLEIRDNTRAHKTDTYDITDAEQGNSKDEKLVVRRGQEFDIKVTFNREYDENNDDLRIVFQFGSDPNTSRRTHQEFILSDQDKVKDWGGWKKSQSGNDVILSIISAVNCQVGQWKLRIDVVKKNDTGYDVFRYAHPDPIYILFNAWCRDDPVYLHDEALREAYVLSEEGVLWRGTYKKLSQMAWNFGQCTDSVLDCCLYLLDENMGANISRGDPTAVCRKISQLVNAPDDNGILVGNWSGEYDDGERPSTWTGSPAIFERFYKNKQPVKYGQCWVFSGLVTTFCRALGIPARSITNFSSAHDTGGNVLVERHYDKDGRPMPDLNNDSVWNFHCWNEAWMSRPDLPEGYGGWQAMDATPQETSDGVFACGPYSLAAIRKGDVNLPYDGPFIFAEVNADIAKVKHHENGEMEIVYINKYSIGKMMSTLNVRNGDREDITDQYKAQEGSEEERIAVERAKLHRSDPGFVKKEGDVKFRLERNSEEPFIGEELRLALVITNTSDEKRTINGTVSVESVYYTGVHYRNIRDEQIRDLTVTPKSEKFVEMTLQQKDYYQELTDHCYCNLSAMCSVEETKFTFVDMEPMRFRKPHLTFKATDEVKKGQTFTIEVSFKNPLDMTLTNCELSVEGPGLQRAKVYKQSNVPANGTYTGSFELTPSKPGSRQVMASFNCTQIYSVTGDRKISVLE